MTQLVDWRPPHQAVGLDLNGDRNKKPGSIVDGASCRFVRGTGVFTGTGYREGCDLATDDEVDALYGAKGGSLRDFDSLWAKSGTDVFHNCQTVNPFSIGVTRTDGEREFFLEQGNGDIMLINQEDTFSRVAIAATIAEVTIAGDTISVGTAFIDKFAAGTDVVYLDGIAITYTTKNSGAGTLTGLTGVPAAGFTANVLVTQVSEPGSAVDVTGTAIKGYCGMSIEGSALVAGRKGAEDVVFYSAPSTFQNPEFYYDFTTNGANAKVMPMPVSAMIRGTVRGYIFGEKEAHAVTGFDTNTGILQTVPVTNDYGAYNERCVIDMGGGAVGFLGQNRFIPINLSTDSSGQLASLPDDDFDYAISPWLAQFDADQADAAMLQYDKALRIVTIAGKIDGVLRTRTFQNQKGLKAYNPQEVRPARCHAYFQGISYFGQNTGDKIFINHSSRTNNGIPIKHEWLTPKLEDKLEREVMLKEFLNRGFMSQGSEIRIRVYRNGSSTASFDRTYGDDIITSNRGTPLGNQGLGDASLGGSTGSPTILVYPYKLKILLVGITGEDFQIQWTITKEGAFVQSNYYVLTGDALRFSAGEAV